MKEIIILSKMIEPPADTTTDASDGKRYIARLEEVVEDLATTPFNKDVRLYHEEDKYSANYNIEYGTVSARDTSGAPTKKTARGYKVSIRTLRHLRKHLKRTKRSDDPDFKIQYTYLELVEPTTSLDQLFGTYTRTVSDGQYKRIRKILLNERDSATKIQLSIQQNPPGSGELVEIKFEYNPRSYPKEIRRIHKGVATLLKRGYAEKERYEATSPMISF